jgi:hypothetical protein
MKVKREAIVLILIIAVLSLYLVMEKRGKTYYKLPKLTVIDEKDVSSLTVKKGDVDVVLRRENEKWVILPGGFPADTNIVKNMVEAIGSLSLTALSSESRNYSIYELDETRRIQIEISDGDQILRKVDLGKVISSFNYTFVKLSNDHRVFHAQGNLKSILDRTVSDLRDKVVMKIDEEIVEVVLSEGEKEVVIVKASAPESGNLTEKEGGKEQKPLVQWIGTDGQKTKDGEIEELIETVSSLRSDDFVENKTKKDYAAPIYKITLRGTKEYSLSFFGKEDGRYLVLSSESEYPFFLSEWKTKKIKKDLDNIIEDKE